MCECSRQKALGQFGKTAEAHVRSMAATPLTFKYLKAIQTVMKALQGEIAADWVK